MKNYTNFDKVALDNINYFQNLLQQAEEQINEMKADLGKAGFEIKFENDPFAGEFVWCVVNLKNREGMPEIKTKAQVSEGDYPVRLLGEYLSLARATRIILGDYNDN